MDARLALGAGEQPSSHRDRPDRPGTQDTVIFSEPGRRMVRWGRREAAGSPLPRVPAPAGYGTGAALSITALVAGAVKHPS